MNKLRRLQLVAHGEPSDVIELSSVSNPRRQNRKRTGRRIVFFDMPSYKSPLAYVDY